MTIKNQADLNTAKTVDELAALAANPDLADLQLYIRDASQLAENDRHRNVTAETLKALLGAEATTYVSSVPLATEGADNDQAVILSGDLAGAVYEKQAGSWVFVGQNYIVPRTTEPATASLPAGFQWHLVLQTAQPNGIYEWDGVNIVQISSDK